MKPLSVYEVNGYIKKIFAGDMILSNVQVEGEVSNFKHHYSGHMYFSLKDEKSKIRCVMFKGDNEKLDMKLEEGLKIVASGYVSVFDREGDYQLYVRSIEEKGVGDLYAAYEKLKKKLDKQGIFDKKFKKELPKLPKKIGVVTSKTGAAIRDIVSIIKRRYPPCDVIIYPSLVQGPNAPKEIIKGLEYLDDMKDIDLIIVGRGGGSIEELFAFNDEELAICIFNMNTPVISAVGHETDFTIADFAADLRAATPSAAAELAVPDMSRIYDDLNVVFKDITSIHINRLMGFKSELNILHRTLKFNDPIISIRNRAQELDGYQKDMFYFMDRRLMKNERKLTDLSNRLSLLNPTHSLEKGYGILYSEQGKIIRSVKDIAIEDRINIRLKDGSLETLVLNIDEGGIEDGIK